MLAYPNDATYETGRIGISRYPLLAIIWVSCVLTSRAEGKKADMSTDTLLKELLRRRHFRYETFHTEYEKVAAQIAPEDIPPSKAQFYRWLSGQLKGGVPYPDACRVLEAMFPPWKAADLFGPYQPGRHMLDDPIYDVLGTILGSVPSSFQAETLGGYWVTVYEFKHGGQDDTPQHHADIAHITAQSERRIQAVNHPPEPRTEGRASPFRNQIEAELVSRHLIGQWRNTSDTRYFGAVHLAVLPGEITMVGYYTGFGSDIAVSVAHWKWVRLADGDDFQGIALREPSAVYDLVMQHSQYDGPIALADVSEAV